MNRWPSELRSTPPSPRTDSVTSSPRTEGGHTIPVGWNCTNSMFSSLAPARRASACPSPVYSHEFDVTLYVLPMPPVASTTAGAWNRTTRPGPRKSPKAPAGPLGTPARVTEVPEGPGEPPVRAGPAGVALFQQQVGDGGLREDLDHRLRVTQF